MLRLSLACSVLCLVAACTQLPALDSTIPQSAKDADYPKLVPLEGLTAGIPEAQTRAADTQAALEARIGALRARANRLKGRIIDNQTRARMQAGVTGS